MLIGKGSYEMAQMTAGGVHKQTVCFRDETSELTGMY